MRNLAKAIFPPVTVGLYFLVSVLGSACAFAAQVVLVRNLDSESYALFNLFFSVVIFLTFPFQIIPAVLSHSTGIETDQGTLSKLHLALFFVSLDALLVLVALLIISFLNGPTDFLLWSSLFWGFSLLNLIATGWCQLFLRWRLLYFLQGSIGLFRFGSFLALIFADRLSAVSALAACAVSMSLTVVILLPFMKWKQFRFAEDIRAAFTAAKKYRRDILPIFWLHFQVNIIFAAIQNLDMLVVYSRWKNIEVADYAFASVIARVGLLLTAPISMFSVVEFFHGSLDRRRLAGKSLFFIVCLAGCSTLFFLLIFPAVLSIFEVQLSGLNVLQVLGASMSIMGAAQAMVMHSLDRIGENSLRPLYYFGGAFFIFIIFFASAPGMVGWASLMTAVTILVFYGLPKIRNFLLSSG